jgi:hypothetical protein
VCGRRPAWGYRLFQSRPVESFRDTLLARRAGPHCLSRQNSPADVETLYLLGEQDRIVGISGYVVRPPQARREKPRVSAFTSANIDKILALKPDLVLTFSDLQADIAVDLIRRGLDVHAFNQRTVAGILDMIRTLGAMVDASERARQLVGTFETRLAEVRSRAERLPKRPRVLFEAWDDPLISGIGCQAAAPPRPRVVCKRSEPFRRWDCINARQRERARKPRFVAYPSLLTSPATRKPPPKCGAFRLQPRSSPLRQTGCWSKPDSNLRSRRNRNACSEAYRVCFKVRARLGMTGAGNGHSPRPRAARTASASTIHHSG